MGFYEIRAFVRTVDFVFIDKTCIDEWVFLENLVFVLIECELVN